LVGIYFVVIIDISFNTSLKSTFSHCLASNTCTVSPDSDSQVKRADTVRAAILVLCVQ
jgi:hypothetical protein